jgi:hypothetical protein
MNIEIKPNIFWNDTKTLDQQSDEVKSAIVDLKENCLLKITTPFFIHGIPHSFLMSKIIYQFNSFNITEDYSYFPEFGSPNFADQITIVTQITLR